MKRYIQFFMPAFFLVFAGMMILVQALTAELTFRFISSTLGGALLMMIYPVFATILKKKLPLMLNWIICIQVFLALYLGTAYEVYTLLPWWDVFVHGIFGVEACFFAFFLLIQCKGEKINLIGFLIFIMAFAMGCGAFWEIIEYLTDLITGSDSQHVFDKPDGVNPIADTMQDLLITFAGVVVTYIAFFIDKYFKFKLTKKIYYDFKMNTPKEKKNDIEYSEQLD